MTIPFVEACQNLQSQLEGIPHHQVERLYSVLMGGRSSTATLASQALGPRTDPWQLAAQLTEISELAASAIPDLIRIDDADLSAKLDRHALLAIAPLVAWYARHAGTDDRRPTAEFLSMLARELADPKLHLLFRRNLRALLLRGPQEVIEAALPGLLRLGTQLPLNDEILARVDLLFVGGKTIPALGEHLSSNQEAFDLLVLRGMRGSPPSRWRAAHLIGCLATRSTRGLFGHDLVELCVDLLEDGVERVWQAAAASLGRIAAHLPEARAALEETLDPGVATGRHGRGAAALGTLLHTSPALAKDLIAKVLAGQCSESSISALACTLPDLASADPDLFAEVLRRLVAAAEPELLARLALVVRDLALVGDEASVQIAGEQVGNAVAKLGPETPEAVMHRAFIEDALATASLVDAPGGFGSRVQKIAHFVLNDELHAQAEQRIRKALAVGWSRLQRVTDADLWAEMEERGRLLYEVRDLGAALFEEDLLSPALKVLEASARSTARDLRGEYEDLRGEYRRLLLELADKPSTDRLQHTEVVRGVVQALDGRTSQAVSLKQRTADPVALAYRLGGFEVLVKLAQLEDQTEGTIAASGLARLLSDIASIRPDRLFECVIILLDRALGSKLLARTARLTRGENRDLLRAAANAARHWSQEPVTAQSLSDLSDAAGRGAARAAIAEVAAAIELTSSLTSMPPAGDATLRAIVEPLCRLVAAVQHLLPVIITGIDALRVDLFGPVHTQEAEGARQRLRLSQQKVGTINEKLEQIARQATENPEKVGSAAKDLAAVLREQLAIPLAQAVESALEPLLSSGEAAAVAEQTFEELEQAGKPPISEDEIPRVGSRLGDFELTEEIHRDDTAVAFKARQISVDRDAAIKVLRPALTGFAGAIKWEEFRQATRTMLRWGDDRIPRVIDFRDEEPVPYLVTELVEGQRLSDLSDSKTVGTMRALQIARAVAGALAHAHKEGVFHHRLTPDQVVIRESGQVSVIDFAAALLGGRVDAAQLPLEQAIYLSPEQLAQDQAIGLEWANDVYALGIILFELLSGRPPFAATSLETMLDDKQTGKRVSLDQLRPDLPNDVVSLVRQMIDPDPSARPSAEAVTSSLAKRTSKMHRRSLVLPSTRELQLEEREVCVVCLLLYQVERVSEADWLLDLLAWWYESAPSVIREQGGIADRHVSDRLYGFFGVDGKEPQEAIGKRAVTAAIDLHRTVLQLAQASGEPVRLRAGVSHGPAFVGRTPQGTPELIVTGSVVERAEASAQFEMDEANLRTDEAVFRLASKKVQFLKHHAVHRSWGPVYLLKERASQTLILRG